MAIDRHRPGRTDCDAHKNPFRIRPPRWRKMTRKIRCKRTEGLSAVLLMAQGHIPFAGRDTEEPIIVTAKPWGSIIQRAVTVGLTATEENQVRLNTQRTPRHVNDLSVCLFVGLSVVLVTIGSQQRKRIVKPVRRPRRFLVAPSIRFPFPNLSPSTDGVVLASVHPNRIRTGDLADVPPKTVTFSLTHGLHNHVIESLLINEKNASP